MIFAACKKDTPCTHQEYFYDIPADELEVIPYKSFDTLTFIRTNTNDTFIFYGNNWSYGYYNSTNNIPECTSTENRKTRTLQFSCIVINSALKIEQRIPEGFTSTSTFQINFNNSLFEDNASDIKNTKPDYLNLQIQNFVYENVYTFSSFSSVNAINKCFYSKQYGIIKMQLKNGEIWELLNKK